MRRWVSSVCIAAGLGAMAGAAGAEFEVASVKPAAPVSGPGSAYRNYMYMMAGGPGTNSPGQFTCTHITLRPLLLRAYDLGPYQLAGPASIDGDRFDIEAKIPPETTKEQFNLMLRNLLAERFGLVLHRETREMPVYELVVAKGGLKMKPEEAAVAEGPAVATPQLTRGKDGLPEFPPGVPGMFAMPLNGAMSITAQMQTIAKLLTTLQYQIGRPVVDKTGLTGTYDFNLTYAYIPTGVEPGMPVPAAAVEGSVGDAGPDLFTAFESQLGLRLEAKKGPVEMVSVDKVNKTPTEN